MSKYRVFELAKTFKADYKVVLDILKKGGFKVANNFSSVDDEGYKAVKNALAPKKKTTDAKPKKKPAAKTGEQKKPAPTNENKSETIANTPKSDKTADAKPALKQQEKSVPAVNKDKPTAKAKDTVDKKQEVARDDKGQAKTCVHRRKQERRCLRSQRQARRRRQKAPPAAP